MGTRVFVDWKMFLRDLCAEHFIRKPMQIGGPERIVEIDESIFTRRKYNRGRLAREQWVFGDIDTTTKEGFMVTVVRLNTNTLIPIIQEFAIPGTTIVSDQWGAYNQIGANGYQHLTVNHSIYFVDPVTFANKNNVENFWMRAKYPSKKARGTKNDMLPSYLQEFMWRQKYKEDLFEKIISEIWAVYPQ